jgi:hypothetical protein
LGQRGGLGAFIAENSTARFFVPKVANNERPPGEFRTFFRRKPKLRKRNKHEFWVKWGGLGAFVRKIQLQVFCSKSHENGPPGRVSHSSSRRKPKLRKRNRHEFWVKQGGLGAFVAENSTASFFVPKVAQTDPLGEFRTILPSKMKFSIKQNNMSFGSKGWIGCVRLRKLTARFLFQKSRKNGPRAQFRTVLSSKTETPKTQQT